MSNNEKIAINELNNINSKIIEEIRKSQNAYASGLNDYDYSTVESLIVKEKETVKNNLGKIISEDKTGSKMLKIFEHITASENNDNVFNKIQQKKAILISDYFIEKIVDDSDKIIYIVEKGKNASAIQVLNSKISTKGFKNQAEAVQLKTILLYEKLLIENYYKSRNVVNDSFFTNSNSKNEVGAEIAMAVGNNLIRQATNIFSKDNLNFAQMIEAEAIIKLCSLEQVNKIKENVNRLDGKLKKVANAIIKDAGK